MCNCLKLQVPGTNIFLTPGTIVKIHRFDLTEWEVKFGWISCNGNRPICAWYLVNTDKPEETKYLSQPDMFDIFIVRK